MYVTNNVQDSTTYTTVSSKYEVVSTTSTGDNTYTFTVKLNSYSIKPKKEELPEEIEWRNNMFRGYKEWQNKLLSEKKSLNVVLKQNRNHIKIRNSMKTKKSKPKKGGKC